MTVPNWCAGHFNTMSRGWCEMRDPYLATHFRQCRVGVRIGLRPIADIRPMCARRRVHRSKSVPTPDRVQIQLIVSCGLKSTTLHYSLSYYYAIALCDLHRGTIKHPISPITAARTVRLKEYRKEDLSPCDMWTINDSLCPIG